MMDSKWGPETHWSVLEKRHKFRIAQICDFCLQVAEQMRSWSRILGFSPSSSLPNYLTRVHAEAQHVHVHRRSPEMRAFFCLWKLMTLLGSFWCKVKTPKIPTREKATKIPTGRFPEWEKEKQRTCKKREVSSLNLCGKNNIFVMYFWVWVNTKQNFCSLFQQKTADLKPE